MNFQNLRPENAVSRAKSILAANSATSKQDALVALMSVIDQTKRKRQWTQDLEDVMKFIIDHCVEEGSRSSSSSIKEALIKYRQQTQQVHHQSLYEVVVHYISKSEEALREAGSAIKVDAVLDLETIESPEQVLANALRGETAVSSSARNMRLSFHWNTLKNVLDVLRNNSRLKATYLDTVKRSFDFCKKWNRREEFVKLCSDPRQGLHSHLLNIELQKDQDKSHSVKLNAADDLEVQIQVRVEQLRAALDMELFHEAVTGAEDIFGLASKYGPTCVPPYIMKRSLKMQIFESLAIVFFRSDAILFHTYFALRHFQLSLAAKKKAPAAEQQQALQQLATTVILGALCTHELSDRMIAESEADFILDTKLQSMAGLLELSRYPRRDMLFADIKHAKVLQYAPRFVQDLFTVLEEGFSPLTLGDNVLPALTQLKSNSDSSSSIIAPCEYVDKLEYAIISRLLKQLSRVYASISIDSFSAILKFSTFEKIESLVLKALSSQIVSGRIDHRARCINFSSATVDIDSLRQLSSIAVRLNSAISMMPSSVTAEEKALKERDKEMRQRVSTVLARNAIEENKMMSQRKKWIECGKEQSENSAKEQKADVIGRQIRETESVVNSEKIRVQNEAEEREKLMKKRKELLDKLKSAGVPEDKIEQILAMPVENRDVEGQKVYEQYMIQKDEKKNEEIKAQTTKLKQLEKRLEHTERARAEEERPLLISKFERHCEEMCDHYEKEALKQRDKDRADWQISRDNKIRFARLQGHAQEFLESLRIRNTKSYNDQKEKFIKEQEKIALDEEAKRVQAAKAKEHEDAIRAQRTKKDEEARQSMMKAADASGQRAVTEGNVDRKEQIISSGWGGRAAASPAPASAPVSAFAPTPAWGRPTGGAESAAPKYTPPQPSTIERTPGAYVPPAAAGTGAPRPVGGGWSAGGRPGEGPAAAGGRSWGSSAGEAPRDRPAPWGQSKPNDAPGSAPPRTGGWGK